MTGVARVLRTVAALLDDAGIPYMVVGSYAGMVHGEPRTTHGLDLVIDPTAETLDRFLATVEPDAFYVDPAVARAALRDRSMFNLIDMSEAWKVDLVIRKDRAFSARELSRRMVATVAEVDVATATAEDTIIAKLEWAKAGGSERQFADVVGIVRLRGASLDRAYIDQWVDDLGLCSEWGRVLAVVDPWRVT